ncbi:PepSY-associated TM helix domain-containing protein [Persicobacter psychrovividus]|uniref:Membrane protein n=1 Tax=Persicobacter psychrovividus TaxID=387638 RepID=A0ABM7VLH7_9BACT|nr:membrane protein [Persicobacter psychrovividus]
MRIKKKVLQLHKLLGLLTGLVVFIVSVTGCCWVFKSEIQQLTQTAIHIPVESSPLLTPTQIEKIAHKKYPNRLIHGVIYGQADEPITLVYYEFEPEFYHSLYIHPYTGEILAEENHLGGFFGTVLRGHVRLWLPKAIGEPLVRWSILIFVVMLFSGIILWWPKKKKHLNQRLKFKWKPSTGWKRKNFDLHAILGFYICGLALILSFTGLVMSFEWIQKGVYFGLGGTKNPTYEIPQQLSEAIPADRPAIDRLLGMMQKEYPQGEKIEIHYPYTDKDCILVEVVRTEGVIYNADYRYFDQRTLEEVKGNTIYDAYKNAHLADKVLRMNYDIHVGAIGGIAGKIIAFFVSLLTATLPLSGFMLWYGRRHKKSRKKSSKEKKALELK